VLAACVASFVIAARSVRGQCPARFRAAAREPRGPSACVPRCRPARRPGDIVGAPLDM